MERNKDKGLLIDYDVSIKIVKMSSRKDIMPLFEY